ncbi:SIMPL domain-containing protein [Desulforamulus profundi]|uniref:SIMPL domain-containing protein n=1 Tax=Desulforamulus profundi TaxID=1383067 RepID=UPI003B75CE8C
MARGNMLLFQQPELIEQGVVFESQPPQYFYTKLNDLKVNMLAEATKDAKLRAEKMASSTGSRIGSQRSAKMGVFQITAVNSNEISDYGINDTSSIEKEITAVVNVEFSVK